MNLFRAPAITVNEAGTISVWLPAKSRLMFFQKGERPILAPVQGPGNFDVQLEELELPRWPVIVTIVKAKYVGVVQKLKQSEIDKIANTAPYQKGTRH